MALSFWLSEIESEEREIGEYTGEVFVAQNPSNYNLFLPNEIETLGFVKSKFHKYSSKDMENFSHQETGYKETKNGHLISYDYAEKLQI